jgi:CYTH domain-containing protein
MSKEIERKFRVTAELPGLSDPEPIRQGYIAWTPDGTEVRVRRRGTRYYLTVKRGSGLERDETEVLLSEGQFDALWPVAAQAAIEKTRGCAEVDGRRVEVDVYGGALEGLVVAEVEFPSVEASTAFSPPHWMGEEVTDDARYKNRALAVDGLPAE